MKIPLFPNVVLVSVGLFLLGAPAAARGTLGERVASVADDAAQMNATTGPNRERPTPELSAQSAPPSANFTVEQITTPDNIVVSEYADEGGTVFAVTWRGPRPPDVSALLGTYFKQYRDAANAGVPSPFGLHAASVHARDVTVQTGGHMGFMWGRAYLPALMPAGVNLSEIR